MIREKPEDVGPDFMPGWYKKGQTVEGIDVLRTYLYNTPASGLSPSGLICSLEAARETLALKDKTISELQQIINDLRQKTLFMVDESGTRAVASLEFHYIEDEMPDDETSVLMATDEGEVVEGYHEDGKWWTTGLTLEAIAQLAGRKPTSVYAWAHLPAAPAKKGPS